jgi:hypothetical protein
VSFHFDYSTSIVSLLQRVLPKLVLPIPQYDRVITIQLKCLFGLDFHLTCLYISQFKTRLAHSACMIGFILRIMLGHVLGEAVMRI